MHAYGFEYVCERMQMCVQLHMHAFCMQLHRLEVKASHWPQGPAD